MVQGARPLGAAIDGRPARGLGSAGGHAKSRAVNSGRDPKIGGPGGECLKIGTWYDPKIPSSKGTKLSQKFEFLGLGESAISRR